MSATETTVVPFVVKGLLTLELVYLFDIDAKYDDPGLGTLLLTDPDVHLACLLHEY